MIFGSTLFLYLLPLAVLPVVFHFLLKQKKRKLFFSTLMFFHRTDPRLHSRRRIREWLILMLRMLLIALVLLALGRPVWRLGSAGGGSDQVIVIDNSASMAGLSVDGQSRLALALDGARKLLTAGSAERTILATTVPDALLAFPETFSSDRADLIDRLERIQPTHGVGEPGRAVEKAIQWLTDGPAGGGTVHVFTDLQENDWSGFEQLSGRLRPGNCAVAIHRIEPMIRDQANGAIRAVQAPPGRLLPRHTYSVGFTIQNTSGYPLKADLNLLDSEGVSRRESVTIQAHLARTVYADMELREPAVAVGAEDSAEGFYWMRAWLEGDSFAGDNEASAVLYCSPRAKVLLVGKPGDFGVLPMALSPGGAGNFTGLVTVNCELDALAGRIENERPVMVVISWESAKALKDQAESTFLLDTIRSGVNLLITPAADEKEVVGGDLLTGWLGAELYGGKENENGIRISTLERRARFWQDATMQQRSGATLADAFNQESIRALRWYPLRLTARYDPLLGSGYDNVVLAERRMDQGMIYLSGLGFDRAWSNLPASGLMVILAQRMALSSLARTELAPRVYAMAAGSTAATAEMAGEGQVVSLAGDSLEWHGPLDGLAGIARSGVYLVAAGDEKYCLAVQADSQEGVDNYYDVTGGNELKVDHTYCLVRPYSIEALGRPDLLAQIGAVDLFVPMLILAALALIGEGLLANPRIRRQSETAPAGVWHRMDVETVQPAEPAGEVV